MILYYIICQTFLIVNPHDQSNIISLKNYRALPYNDFCDGIKRPAAPTPHKIPNIILL